MLDLTYVGESSKYKIEFKKVSENIVSISGKLKAKTKGFTLSREGKNDAWDYKNYTTIYRELDGEIQFSNDGSVWVKPLPKVNFYTNGGGTLEGETLQEVYTYEELLIPTPVASEDYEFAGWNPEIPTNGEIEGDKSYIAEFVSTLPPPEPEPTLEDEVHALKDSVAALEENSIMLTETVDSILTDVIPSLI